MDTILFDGVCNFCNAAINFIIDRDRTRRFVFAPLQSAVGRDLLQQHDYPTDTGTDLRSVVLIKEGRVYEKSDAALEIARHLGSGWPLLYAGKIIPRLLRDGLYDWIARNRYRWFGKQEACRLPTPALRQRFLA